MVEENGRRSLTRADNFQVASNGNLITQDGQLVLGYQAGNQAGNAAKATQNFSVSTNLDLGAAAGTTFSSQVQVFDSLGNSYLATVTFRKSVDAASAWTPQELICEAAGFVGWVGVGSRVVRHVCEGAFRLVSVLVHRSGGTLSLWRVLCCVRRGRQRVRAYAPLL
jgi:hypothetical protein